MTSKTCKYCGHSLFKHLNSGYIIVAGHKFCSYSCVIDALWDGHIKLVDIWK